MLKATQMGGEAPWIATLRAACARHGQAHVARQLNVSPATVSQVLAGKYKADTRHIQARAEGSLMGIYVDCPAVGEIPRDRCQDYQRRPYAATNPLRVQLNRDGLCKTCPHNTQKPKEELLP